MARLSERGIARALSLISYIRITLIKAETFLAHGYIGPYECYRDTDGLINFTDKVHRQIDDLSVVGSRPGETEQGEHPESTHLPDDRISHLNLMTLLLKTRCEDFLRYLDTGDRGDIGEEWIDPGNIAECYDHISEVISQATEIRDQLDAFTRGEPVPPLPITPDYDA